MKRLILLLCLLALVETLASQEQIEWGFTGSFDLNYYGFVDDLGNLRFNSSANFSTGGLVYYVLNDQTKIGSGLLLSYKSYSFEISGSSPWIDPIDPLRLSEDDETKFRHLYLTAPLSIRYQLSSNGTVGSFLIISINNSLRLANNVETTFQGTEGGVYKKYLLGIAGGVGINFNWGGWQVGLISQLQVYPHSIHQNFPEQNPLQLSLTTQFIRIKN